MPGAGKHQSVRQVKIGQYVVNGHFNLSLGAFGCTGRTDAGAATVGQLNIIL